MEIIKVFLFKTYIVRYKELKTSSMELCINIIGYISCKEERSQAIERVKIFNRFLLFLQIQFNL